MAMSFVAASSAQNDGNSTVDVVINKPTGVQDGDVLIANYTSNTNFWNLPAGFTALESQLGDSGNMRSGIAWKLASSEPSTYTFSKDVGSPDTAPQVVNIVAFRGCDQSSPIQDSSADGHGSVSASTDPGTSITVAQNAAPGRLIMWRIGRKGSQSGAGVVPTYSESSGGWDEAVDNGSASNSGNTAYSSMACYTGDFDSTSGTRGGPAGGIVSNTSTDANVFFMVALLGSLESTDAPATVAEADATAYAPASLTVTTTAAYGAATADAHDATVLTGVAAENVGHAAATATAYDAMGWVIHPVDVGAIAFNASVAVGTNAGSAAASAAAQGAGGYFGAPASRKWRIAAENRSWTIAAESRVWRIPSED